MKKLVFFLVVLLVSSCGVTEKVISGVSVALETSPHVRYVLGTETILVNPMDAFVRLIGYDGTEIGVLGPGAQVTDIERLWFESIDVPVVGLVYKDQGLKKLVGVWGKTLHITSLNNALYEIRSFNTPEGNTAQPKVFGGAAYTSFSSAIPKPQWGNMYHLLIVGGSRDDVYIDIQGQTHRISFGEVFHRSYRVDNYYYSSSRTIHFSYRIVRDGKVLGVFTGSFCPRTHYDGPGGDVIILSPKGPQYN